MTHKKKGRKNLLSATQSEEYFIPMQYNSMVKNIKLGNKDMQAMNSRRRGLSSRNEIDLNQSDQKVLSLNIGRDLKAVP